LEPSANISHHVLDLSAGVPSGPPEVTVTEAFAQHVSDPDKIGFLGMWCAPVVQVTFASVAVKHFTKREIKNVSEIDVNEIKNVYEIYKNEFEKENYKNEFEKNESEIKNLSELYKCEFEIENARSEFDKNVSEINNEFEVISEVHKMEVQH